MSNMLKVPLIFQPRRKPYCGHTCSKMILKFHGVNKRLLDIVQAMPTKKNGIDAVSLGTYFLEQNFDVVVKLWLKEFPSRFINLPEDEVAPSLLRWAKRKVKRKNSGPNENEYRRSIPRFIRAGGKIIPGPVSLADLKNALNKKLPPILNLDVSVMYGLKHKNAGHYVIPVSIKNRQITINDPNSRHGGIKTYAEEQILHACYSWSSGALFIKPKKRA